MRLSGIAAQFSSTNGPAARALRAWISRATSSLPVPFSPMMRMRESLAAAWAMSSRTARIPALSPTIRSSMKRLSRSVRFSRRSVSMARALRTTVIVRSSESGFSRKSKAPIFVACTAREMFA